MVTRPASLTSAAHSSESWCFCFCAEAQDRDEDTWFFTPLVADSSVSADREESRLPGIREPDSQVPDLESAVDTRLPSFRRLHLRFDLPVSPPATGRLDFHRVMGRSFAVDRRLC